MALADQIEVFARTSPKIKLAVGVGISAVLWGLFLYLFYIHDYILI